MNRSAIYLLMGVIPALLLASAAVLSLAQAPPPADTFRSLDPSGLLTTFTTNSSFDLSNPFFQSLGSNHRACVTCHQPQDAWSITPAHLQQRFAATLGLDPIFQPVDGTNSPLADLSTLQARRQACSMLLSKGLIRIGIGIPQNAEFTLAAVEDPYGYASAKELSLFRRPLPATNLPFLTAVMWDGRETIAPIHGDGNESTQALEQDLQHQALDATLGHAQATTPPTQQQLAQIVAFETALFTAQSWDRVAGSLDSARATGGPVALSNAEFYIGINDPLGANPTGAPFDPNAFTLFSPWSHLGGRPGEQEQEQARAAIVRGEALFNTKPITITGVAGLNDRLGQRVIVGSCTTCHDTPDVGNHSVSVPLNIGIADASRRTPDLPLYTLRNTQTGQEVQTSDPGRALITGKWKDIGKFKGPILRGLAGRAPYFHNGSAATLEDVVDFYDTRFRIGLTSQEKHDLVAFLRSL